MMKRAIGASLAGALLCCVTTTVGNAQPRTAEPVAAFEHALASADASLRANEPQVAESRYRAAIAEGWLLIGALRAADGNLTDAKSAFTRASTLTAEAGAALRALAIIQLRLGEIDSALRILTRLAADAPRDSATRRLLAQALVAAARPADAVQVLEEAHSSDPDPELTFALASGYLRLGKLEAAERLFGELTRARPTPQTRVLIGRTYRDAGEYVRARRELQAALNMDARVRRAHYYLGTIDIMSEGIARLEPAIAAFRQELTVSPRDPAASLGLGLALVHARRHADALPHLQLAVKAEPMQGNAFYYLGRCLLGLGRPREAAEVLRRSLDLARTASGAVEPKNIHYQLGVALRAAGRAEEAAAHFAEAERAWEGRLGGDRERLSRYLADAPEPQSGATVAAAVEGSLPFADVPREARAELAARVRQKLAGACMNVGIVHAQSGRFERAVEFLEEAAGHDPAFPRVQYSLGVAYFNARQFDNAAVSLERALAAAPQDPDIRRMLALSLFNVDAYARAAQLLENDPRRESDPSLQYAYGVALARSDRAAEAEAIFARLLADHGDRAELHVVLGQGHAQQGDFDDAIRSLQRALALDPKVAEANRTLGNIYLRQGRFAEAITALRAELASHPGDLKARHALAAALELEGHAEEAVPLLRSILKTQPQHADARYLLGKLLLAQGQASEAVQHLETAARLSPDDASVRYQLGQAYQKTGRADLAEEQFELFRQIKDKRRGKTP